MRYSVIICKLNHLRVDEHQFYFFRFCLVKDTCDDAVYTYTLTGTGGAGNQQMRCSFQVSRNGIARNILTYGKIDFGFCIAELRRVDNITDGYHVDLIVFDLDADSRLSRNRSFYSDALRFQIEGDVIGEADDTLYFYANIRMYFVSCDRRTLSNICYLRIDVKVMQSLFQFLRLCLQSCIYRSFSLRCSAFIEQCYRREFVSFHRLAAVVDFLRIQCRSGSLAVGDFFRFLFNHTGSSRCTRSCSTCSGHTSSSGCESHLSVRKLFHIVIFICIFIRF